MTFIPAYVSYLRTHHITHGTPREPNLSELFRSSVLLANTLSWKPRRADESMIVGVIRRLDNGMDVYEDADLQRLARTQMPLDELRSRATMLARSSGRHSQDHLAELLVSWFKQSYMNWVDPIRCQLCERGTDSDGSGGAGSSKVKMECIGQGEVSLMEQVEGGAGRVELWKCQKCGRIERFPRYNDCRMLMKTRKGRCGEFANLFTLFLRAAGFRARYVWNLEDHVWNEYHSESIGRWVHLDPCEGTWNSHLLYTTNWKKHMTYVFGFSTDGCADVTLGYMPSGRLPLGRDKILERDLCRVIRITTERRRQQRHPGGATVEGDDDWRARLEREDAAERSWLLDWSKRKQEEADRVAKEADMNDDSLAGRQSGQAEWKIERGEAGQE
ncbi:Peptide:N-glycanase [Phaffia rhodozyma]|uniref:Peptide:N-glycanase n=1 Tax=Phaffia rhodozyma TaxID=264483 RepID=A0A0F7SNG7_PHARH|nr:Peptide:N-glycanase [Phaffia rhodozyma]